MEILFALIGCGRIAKRHAEQIIKHGKLVAVCDIDIKKANEFANLYNAKAYYNIDNLLLEHPNLTLISICTPNGLHCSHSIKCLNAGANVLCEKPLCINLNDGIKMILTAKAVNKKLFVVKQNRYNPPVVFLKKIITENKLGKILSFQINCFWNRPAEYYTNSWKGTKKMDGGTLYTQFSHFIDLLFWLLGDVNDVKSVIINNNHPNIEIEDSGIVLFNMKSKVIGSLNYTVNSFNKNMEGSFTVFGEKGTVKVGGQYLNELEYFNVNDMQAPNLPIGNTANGYGFYQGSMSNHNIVYENIIAALQNKPFLLADAEEGIKTVEIIEKIYNKKS